MLIRSLMLRLAERQEKLKQVSDGGSRLQALNQRLENRLVERPTRK
jgi:hypothetical protein